MLKVGDIVCRGPDWEYGDQDGKSRCNGKIALGVVTRDNHCSFASEYRYKVCWANGAPNVYRHDDIHKDIVLYNPSPVKSLEELL